MTQVVRRILTATVLAVLLGALTPSTAGAAPDVSMSDVESQGESLTGVLTFRGAEVVQVDPGSLTATIDGQEREADVASSTSIQRSSVLVIDTSGSMGSDGMATVRAATRAYLAEAPKDVKVGVATFANTAGVDLKPSDDRQQVQRIVDGLAARGETSLYAGVLAAAKALGNDGDRSMVLLSDGADTVSANPEADLAKATEAVRDRGIRVDVVRFRTEDKDTMNALDGFAEAGGGSVLAADDAEAVGDAFQTAARALNSQAPFEITTPEQLTGRHVVRLEGSANGAPFAVERTVTLDGSAEAQPAPTTAEAVPAQAELATGGLSASSPWPWIGAFAIGTAIFLLAFGALTPTVRSRRELRLAGIDDYVVPVTQWSRREGQDESKPISERLVDFGERRMAKRGSTTRTMLLINRADLPLRAGEWYVLCGVAIIVGIALFMVLLPGHWIVGALVGLVVGIVAPQMVLRVLAARRARAFERVLPDSLLLVATSLKSGFGLMQSLDAVAQDSAPPVDKEFARALAETRIGTDIADALERMAERMGSEAMGMAVMAIRIQREVGGNLAETLETTAHTLREREVLFRQVKALSGSVVRSDLPATERFVGPVLAGSRHLATRLSPGGTVDRLAKGLDRAGNPFPWTIDRIMGVKGMCLLLGLALGLAFGGISVGGVLVAIVLAAALFYLPDLLLYNAALRRQERTAKDLADVLDVLTVCVEAGQGFDGAILRVARTTDGPLSGEFARVLSEIQLGKTRAQAFSSMGERVVLPEVKNFVSAIVQADRLGIPIAKVLREQTSSMRVVRRQKAEEQAQKVTVKILFPLLFCIFPAMFVVIIGPGAIRMMENIFGPGGI